MSDTARLFLAAGLGLALVLLFVPLMRSVAVRTDFYDRPEGYKAHRSATPYLGGVAVIGAFLISASIAADVDEWITIVTCVILLCIVGTVDDRVNLPISVRLAFQVGCAIALATAGTGWEFFTSDALNLAITVFWVVGIINAFNLMDNQDGAAPAVAASCLFGIAFLSQANGDLINAVLALALAGACIGFLPFNLAKPSRIFLGDGGSMPIGLAVAALIMAAPWGSANATDLLIAVPLAGIPILDTTMVVFSRRRRGAAVLSGARDHLTHRLLAALNTPRHVAAALAIAQLALCALAAMLHELDSSEVAVISVFYLGAGAASIVILDDPRWLPGLAAERAQVAEEISG